MFRFTILAVAALVSFSASAQDNEACRIISGYNTRCMEVQGLRSVGLSGQGAYQALVIERKRVMDVLLDRDAMNKEVTSTSPYLEALAKDSDNRSALESAGVNATNFADATSVGNSEVLLQLDRKAALNQISVMPPAQQVTLLELIGTDAPAMRSAMCQQIDDVIIMSSPKLRNYCGK